MASAKIAIELHIQQWITDVVKAAQEAEILLSNYLHDEKFPPGSDCEEVRDMLRAALNLERSKLEER